MLTYRNYQDLEDGIQDLPKEYYPSLLIAIVKAACRRGVFSPVEVIDYLRNAIRNTPLTEIRT